VKCVGECEGVSARRARVTCRQASPARWPSPASTPVLTHGKPCRALAMKEREREKERERARDIEKERERERERESERQRFAYCATRRGARRRAGRWHTRGAMPPLQGYPAHKKLPPPLIPYGRPMPRARHARCHASTTGVPRSLKTSFPLQPYIRLSLGPFGGPRDGGCFI